MEGILTQSNIVFTLGLLAIIFNVYKYLTNPQIKTNQVTISLRDDMTQLQKQVLEIKETHLRSVEMDIRTLTASVNELAKTVVKLSTIIDERIPRAQPI